MYSVAGYGQMIADRVRMNAYVEALRQAVTPDSIVLDVGTGTGIFALLACRFGARRVYAIEPADAIQVARELAAVNGCADRIEFRQAVSTAITLPERATVVISDLSGVLPLLGQHIPSIVDLRQRLLAPGAVMVPARDALWAAVISAPDLYARSTEPWGTSTYGFDMSPARRIVVNDWGSCKLTTDMLITPSTRWATLDYETITDPNVSGSLSWTIAQPGTAHGVAVGFERTLAPGIQFSSAPDSGLPAPIVYGTVFMPWPAPVELKAGDEVTVGYDARLLGDDYTWIWRTRIRQHEQVPIEFTQSTLAGTVLSTRTLRKSAATAVPILNEDGRVARLVLDAMNGGLSLGEIAERLAHEHAARFPRVQDALNHAAMLSRRYSADVQALAPPASV